MAGDQSLLKRINRVALVRLVKAEPGLSRVELAKRTGLTKTTVGMLVQELIDEGWLAQREPAAAAGVGRRPSPITIDGTRVGLLGAEIGVDYLHAVAVSLTGQVVASMRVPYQHRDVGRSLRSLAGLVAEARQALLRSGRKPLGLGVGVPGMLDVDGGLLRFAPNLGWHGVALRDRLAAALAAVDPAMTRGGFPVAVLNEARAAALSEYVFGEEHHAGPLVYLSIGIGLGAGIVLRDRLYLGHDGFAGEVGHTILQRGGPRCACGRRGCAEVFVSQRAVSREVTGKEKPILAVEELVERLRRGDRATVKAATRAGAYLGLLLQNLENTIDPAVIVLGGPLCQLGDVFLETALAEMRENDGAYAEHRVDVRTCRFGLSACAVGAAGSVFHGVLHAYDEAEAGKAAAPRARKAGLPPKASLPLP